MDRKVSTPTALPLLRTKLNRPQISPDLIDRPHLVARLNEGLAGQLILISAPAGFGKSILLGQWLEQTPLLSAWLSLDDNDNDLLFFISYLIAAIQTRFSSACATTQSLLQAAQTPSLDYLTTTLINEIADLTEEFILVLDDYHQIQTPTIHQLVIRLLDQRPLPLHLAISSRIDPPFSLSRWRGRGDLYEIRSNDLRFSTTEIENFLTLAVKTPLPHSVAATLIERTEGWIVGLRLAAISLKTQADYESFLASFKGSLHRPVMEYLLDEVLTQQPEEIQDFLLNTSILGRFCLSLGQAVYAPADPQPNPQHYLAWLKQTNLFLVNLDEEGQWYRYHHLFQELLQHRLQLQRSRAEIDALHHRAGRWFAQAGFLDEALRHFLAGNDSPAAAQLVEQHYHDFINREEWPAIRRWLGLLPATLIEQQPSLLLAQSWYLHQEFKLATVSVLLAKAEKLLEMPDLELAEAKQRAIHGEINALRAQLLYFRHDFEAVLSRAEQALNQLPASAVFARSLAMFYLGAAYQALGRADEALQFLQGAIEAELRHNTITLRMFLMQAFVHRVSANFGQLLQTGRLFFRAAEETRLWLSITWANYHLGWLFYEWNELETAERHLLVVVKHRYHAHQLALRDSFMGLALIYLAWGEVAKVRQTLTELEAFARQTDNPMFLTTFYSFTARTLLQQGEIRAALQESEVAMAGGQPGPLQLFEHAALTRARVLIGQGRGPEVEEALALLDQWQPLVEQSHNTLRLIEILALRALAGHKSGQTKAALVWLKHAVTLARPGRLIRTFVDLGPAMAGLLELLAKRGVEPDYVAQLLAAWPDLARTAPDPPRIEREVEHPLETLTNRELEILELLQQRLTNKEIAATLFISPLTVQRHASTIYQKLGVNNRRQAVVQAVSHGILPAE